MNAQVQNLSFSYGRRRVLKDVCFEVCQGEVVAVLGPNGAGKSTLFKCMLGRLKGYEGRVLLNGRDIKGFSARELAGLAAYIPQFHDPAFHYTVLDMVLMGTTAQMPVLASPGRRQTDCARKALERVGIGEFWDRGYNNLSGGERQLVLIARALAQNARLLVMDEPTSSLDYGNQHRVLNMARDLAAEGYAVLVSMHNPDQAFRYADKVMALLDGEVAAFGAPSEVLDAALASRLYKMKVRIHALEDDGGLVCIPVDLRKTEEELR